MANYVLVHGAWGGGQTYAEVPGRLEAEGHEGARRNTDRARHAAGRTASRDYAVSDHVDTVVRTDRTGRIRALHPRRAFLWRDGHLRRRQPSWQADRCDLLHRRLPARKRPVAVGHHRRVRAQLVHRQPAPQAGLRRSDRGDRLLGRARRGRLPPAADPARGDPLFAATSRRLRKRATSSPPATSRPRSRALRKRRRPRAGTITKRPPTIS